jgi:hypothetical protein
MRRIRIVGLCLIAVFAVVAVAATSASAAEPEWGHCVAHKKGEYTEGNCKTKSAKAHKGKFEWLSGAVGCYAQKKGEYTNSSCTTKSAKAHKGKYEKTGGGKFTAAGGAGVLKTFLYSCRLPGQNGGNHPGSRVPHEDCESFYGGIPVQVECASEHASGESAGSDEVANVSVRFTGCSTFGLPATSPGLPAGEIQTNQLKGRLGYINKSAHEVGVLLEPAAAGGQFAEFEVLEGELMEHVGVGSATEGAFYEEAHGAPTGNDGIISPIVPVNQMTHTFTQNYRIEVKEPYLPLSCPISPLSCPRGTESGLDEGTQDEDDLNIPSHFEGGQFEALEVHQVNTESNETTAWAPAGEEITNVNTVEGEAEIKG